MSHKNLLHNLDDRTWDKLLVCEKPIKNEKIVSKIIFFQKKYFSDFFLWFLTDLLLKHYPKFKKSICFKNLKVLSIWNRYHVLNQTIFGDFVAIFEKNHGQKKNFFSKIFFFQILGNAFFEHNSSRFDEKKIRKFWKKIFENLISWKKCNFRYFFWILIGFTHTNNLSQVLSSWLCNKFLCDMHTLCTPTHTKSPVCS